MFRWQDARTRKRMSTNRIAEWTLGFTLAGSALVSATPADTPPAAAQPSMLVLDLELSGDLGGPEFSLEHDARLKLESQRLRSDLSGIKRFRLVEVAPAQATLERLKSQHLYLHDCGGCDLELGRQLGVDWVFVSWVNRISGLILQLTYEIHAVQSGQMIRRKTFDFRGDNDNAWNHAVDYMVRDLNSEEPSAP
jgi:Protein of unknown function (DUF2380)